MRESREASVSADVEDMVESVLNSTALHYSFRVQKSAEGRKKHIATVEGCPCGDLHQMDGIRQNYARRRALKEVKNCVGAQISHALFPSVAESDFASAHQM